MAKLYGNLYPRTKASNSTGVLVTWNERKNYSLLAFPETLIVNMIDFWGKDKFYGRVSPTGYPMRINKSSLKQLKFTTGNKALYAVNFVADAWQDLVRKMQDLATTGAVRRESPFANLSAVEAWNSPEDLYHEYLTTTIYPELADKILSELKYKRQIKDFKGFLATIGYYINNVADQAPLTLSGFMESDWVNPHVSGLCISMSKIEHDKDFLKCENYIYDESFKLFARMAYEHGFMVDRNAPWRIVADLNSPNMQEYMRGINSQPEISPSLPLRDECGDLIPFVDTPQIERYGTSSIVEGLVRRAPGYQEFGNKNLFLMSSAPLADTDGKIQTVLFNSNKYYISTSERDMEILKLYLLDFYNNFVDENEVFSDYEQVSSLEARKGKISNAVGEVKEVAENDQVYIPGEIDCPGKLRTKLFFRKKENIQVLNPEQGRFGYKWMLGFHYRLRKAERKQKDSTMKRRRNLRDLYTMFYNFSDDKKESFIESLRIFRTTMLGPINPNTKNEQGERATFEYDGNSIFSGQDFSSPGY